MKPSDEDLPVRLSIRWLTPCLVLLALGSAALAAPWTAKIAPGWQVALDTISANSLRGHVSFLASDLLEGRGTPSRGLDLAAEYIASQFRRAGLEPGGDDGYFQTTMISPRGMPEKMEKVRNVIGILRGSDPVLKDTCLLVSAHYDHLGTNPNAMGDDKIFNGANDDASGTASVVELALALGRLKVRPKRSIVFVTFYGEERGLLGSRFYATKPVFPIVKTVANINLEQVGRTDDLEGPRVAAVSVTGADFSDLGEALEAAGKLTGVAVQKHPINSDAFFGRSDNQALADAGVPAHTLCTAFMFPDYHRAGDHWDKIDYANMERVDKMVALALLVMADTAREPKWNESNPKAKRYHEAWKARRQP